MNSYIRHAWQAIRYNRSYMLISMVGLVLSLSGAITIARYVRQELTVDHYIPDLDRTMLLYDKRDESKINHDVINHNGLEDYPTPHKDRDVERYTQFYAYDNSIITTGNNEFTLNTIVADSSFLNLLPRKLLKGNLPKNEFDAVVTADIAERLWNKENPLGQTISLFSDNDTYTVVGVVDRPETKSNYNFDVLLTRELDNYMSNKIGWVICLLKPGADIDSINARLQPYEKRVSSYYTFKFHMQLMPLSDFYFDPSFLKVDDSRLTLGGNSHNIHILELVSVMLILVGLFNFLNIYSIVMVTRSRDFAVRKAFGAKKSTIFFHIFTENMIIALTAVLMAWAIIGIVSPLLSRYYNIEQQTSPEFDLLLSSGIAIIFPSVVSIIAAISIWRTSNVHSMDNTEPRKAILLRRYLLLLPQMALTLILITVSIYFMRQMHFMLHADMGFETENILSFRLWEEQGREIKYNMMSDEEINEMMKKRENEDETMAMALDKIRALPQVVASAMWNPDNRPSIFINAPLVRKVQKSGDPDNEWVNTNLLFLSGDQAKVFDIKVSEGLSFNDYENGEIDPMYAYKAQASRSLLEKLGIHDINTELIQTESRMWYSMDMDCSGNPPYEVIGVIDHLRLSPLSGEDLPVMIFGERNVDCGKPIIRYRHEDKEKLLESLTNIYQEINGEGTFPDFEFSEDVMDVIYEKDQRAARIYATFALMSIMISCLGLYGVVAYDMQRRRREFTIRRVQGARQHDILRLVFKPYFLTIIIAAAISLPVSLYAITRYQSNYYDHVSMQPWGFIAGVAVIALVAYFTIRSQVKLMFKKESMLS